MIAFIDDHRAARGVEPICAVPATAPATDMMTQLPTCERLKTESSVTCIQIVNPNVMPSNSGHVAPEQGAWPMKVQIKLALAIASLTISPMVNAATVYQSLPDLTVSPVQASYCSSCNAFLPFRIYDNFTLTSAATVNSVTFAVDRRNAVQPSVNLSFFNLNGTLPGAQLATYDFLFADLDATAQPTSLDGISLYTANIGALSLLAGSYDISFYNPNGLGIPAYQKAGGNLYQSGNFFSPSTFYPDRVAAFSLNSATGAVPEPGTWAMMIVGFGLAGTALRRRSTKVVFA